MFLLAVFAFCRRGHWRKVEQIAVLAVGICNCLLELSVCSDGEVHFVRELFCLVKRFEVFLQVGHTFSFEECLFVWSLVT